MKTKLIAQILLVAFLAAPVAMAQSKNDRQLKREMRKLQRKLKKTRKLNQDDLLRVREEVERVREDTRNQWLEQSSNMRDQSAQWKEKAEYQQQMARKEMRKAMEQQKMAFEVQKKNQKLQEEMLKNKRIIWDNERGKLRAIQELPHVYHFDYDFDIPEVEIPDETLPEVHIPDVPFSSPERGIFTFTENDNSRLQINKELEGETADKDFTYQTEEDATMITFSVEGTADEGDLTIQIFKPDGSMYKEIEISPLADMEWSKTVKFDEEDSSDYLGEWKVKVSANNTTGSYSVRIHSR